MYQHHNNQHVFTHQTFFDNLSWQIYLQILVHTYSWKVVLASRILTRIQTVPSLVAGKWDWSLLQWSYGTRIISLDLQCMKHQLSMILLQLNTSFWLKFISTYLQNIRQKWWQSIPVRLEIDSQRHHCEELVNELVLQWPHLLRYCLPYLLFLLHLRFIEPYWCILFDGWWISH